MTAGSDAESPRSRFPALDWSPRFDERSRAYGIADVAPAHPTPLDDSIELPVGPVLNQGSEGACVGFGSADAANAHAVADLIPTPADDLLGDADALGLYRLAQKLDERPGENYVGTSVLAGMLAGRQLGLWREFRWAFGVGDVRRALVDHRLPVVIGVPWCQGMYETDAEGRVKVQGQVVGGHCLVVRAFRRHDPLFGGAPSFEWLNSWGPGYGVGGCGRITANDLAWLLASQGEAAVPIPVGAP